MVFENGVKNIQAAAYNGARTVLTLLPINDATEGRTLEAPMGAS